MKLVFNFFTPIVILETIARLINIGRYFQILHILLGHLIEHIPRKKVRNKSIESQDIALSIYQVLIGGKADLFMTKISYNLHDHLVDISDVHVAEVRPEPIRTLILEIYGTVIRKDYLVDFVLQHCLFEY